MKKNYLIAIIMTFSLSYVTNASESFEVRTKIVTVNNKYRMSSSEYGIESIGGVNGGGGNSVVCTNANGKKSTKLLDFVEAEALKSNTIATFQKSLDYTNIIKDRLSVIQKISPGFALKLENEFSIFQKDVLFIPGSKFSNTNDSNHVSIPVNCILVQTAVQKEKIFPNDKKFFINNDVWKNLPAAHKAGLVLHELVYSLLRAQTKHIRTSESTRFLISLIFSDEIKSLDKLKFASLLITAGFKYVTIDETMFTSNPAGWLYRRTGEKPVVFTNVATFGNIQQNPKNGELKAVLHSSVLKLGVNKLLVKYAQFSKDDVIYALAILEDSSTTIKSCWVKIVNNKTLNQISPEDIPNLPNLNGITENTTYLNNKCTIENKGSDYEDIKSILFSAL